jgi:hypothetical protein
MLDTLVTVPAVLMLTNVQMDPTTAELELLASTMQAVLNVLVVMVSVFLVLTASISTNVLLTITAVPTQLVSITTADTNAHAMKVTLATV